MISIFGKKNCPYCTKAVDLAAKSGESYQYWDITDDPYPASVLKFIGYRTVPVIFDDLEYVGGYNDFVDYMQEEA